MNVVVKPAKLFGDVMIPPSKSLSHRAIIAASLAEGKSIISNVLYSKDIKATIDLIKSLNVKVGLSVKPKTDVAVLEPFLKDLDLVLVMSVEPGFGGQKFMDSALDKLKWLSNEKKEKGYHYLIEVDGGINAETAQMVAKNGCEVVVAGTYVFKANKRKDVINYLKKL